MLVRILLTIVLLFVVAGCTPEAAAQWQPFCAEVEANPEEYEAYSGFCNMIAAAAVMPPQVEPAEWDQDQTLPDDTVDDPIAPTEEEAVLEPEVCLIKGNVGRRGALIYHVPGQINYERVVISPEKGERLFCSEQEALDAGWRKALR